MIETEGINASGMAESLTVNLGERSYPITFGVDLSADVSAQVGEFLAAGRKIAVVTDRTDPQLGHVLGRLGLTLQALKPLRVAPRNGREGFGFLGCHPHKPMSGRRPRASTANGHRR